jgi:3-hydroxybutyryl-CoA dehydrogenase
MTSPEPFPDDAPGPFDGRHVVVAGGGTMGRGIAHAFLIAGSHVHVVESDAARADDAQEATLGLVAQTVARGRARPDSIRRAASRLSVAAGLAAAPTRPAFAVEAVVEDLSVKTALLCDLEALEPAVLATNTSALSIDGLAQSLRRPERFVGLHFFNPVPAMKLVEVVLGARTDDQTLAAACEAVVLLGKTPVVVQDAPGFASSRLGVLVGVEAIRMVEQGVADPESVDAAMTLGYRHPVGPLRLTDMVGLDVRLAIAEDLAGRLGGRFAPPDLLRRLVAQGRLGAKTGRGFYDWSTSEPRPLAAAELVDDEDSP